MTTTDVSPRWRMLTILCVAFFALTLNWFTISTAFGEIQAEFGVGLTEVSLLVSLFIVTYALLHVPGGMLATRIGMKQVMVLGLGLESLATIASGLAPNFALLALFRVIAGVGASIFIAVGFAAAVVWSEGRRQVTLALGISSGAAFGLGAAVAFYVWIYVQQATGWRISLVLAGVLGLIATGALAALFRTPPTMPFLHGTSLDRRALDATLRSRDMWIYGIAMLGAYGAYFTTSQLLPGYALAERGFSEGPAGLLAALVALAGIPASLLGGIVADRTARVRPIIVWSLVLTGLALVSIPLVPAGGLWLAGLVVGFFVIFGFTAWSAVPSRLSLVDPEHLGTATGLMLTIAGVGGFVVPLVFGEVVPATSYATGWVLLGIVTVVLALVGLAGRNADTGTASATAVKTAEPGSATPS